MLKQLQDVMCKSLQSALIHQHQRLLCRPGMLWPSFEHLRGQIPLQTQSKNNRKIASEHSQTISICMLCPTGGIGNLKCLDAGHKYRLVCLKFRNLQVFSIHRQIGLTTWTFHAIQSESCAVTLAMDHCMVRALQQGK